MLLHKIRPIDSKVYLIAANSGSFRSYVNVVIDTLAAKIDEIIERVNEIIDYINSSGHLKEQ